MFFFSWSKKLSLSIAHATASFFNSITERNNDIWISDTSIQYGDGFFYSLTSAIKSCDYGVFFLTKDNIRNPWINFEAGGVFAMNRRMWCILAPNIDKNDLENSPFINIQTIKMQKREFETFFADICRMYGDNWDTYKKNLDKLWDGFYEEILKIVNNRYINLNEIISTDDMASIFINSYSTSVSFDRIISLSSGYETHELYDFVLNKCKKRLWIYGRKNKKLFDVSHMSALIELGQKITCGLDFKCLFFDVSASDYDEKLLQKKRNFKHSLQTSIDDALDRCEETGIDFQRCFRFYNNLRNTAMIIIDNSIFYSHVYYTLDGTPKHLTNAPFSIVDCSTKIGENFISEFESVWESSRIYE